MSCGVRRSLFFSSKISLPPEIKIESTSEIFAGSAATFEICIANSLVGAIIKACVTGIFFNRSIVGIKNAKVFPVPVFARTIKSFPVRAAGMTFSCTGVGEIIPLFLSSSQTFGFTFKSLNDAMMTSNHLRNCITKPTNLKYIRRINHERNKFIDQSQPP